MATKADIIFYGGTIITMDERTTRHEDSTVPNVEAVAIGKGVILEVGSLERVFSYADENTQVIYLNNQTLMPGFIEPHQHAVWCARKRRLFTDIGGMKFRKFAEISTTMKNKIAELKPGEWGAFWGWDPELVPDLPILSATYLDEHFSTDNPIFVIGQSLHVAWLNSRGLELVGITKTTPDPDGGVIDRDAAGEPTGRLIELPSILMGINKLPDEDYDAMEKSFRDQFRYYASVGFTTVTDLLYTPTETTNKILRNLADQPDCPARLALYNFEIPTKNGEQATNLKRGTGCCPNVFEEPPEKVIPETIGFHNDRLWDAGIKMIADGSAHCGTMAIREPYMHTPLTEILGFEKPPNYGIMNIDTQALEDTVKRFHEKGTQISIHCHGERSCEQILRAYEKFFGEDGMKDRRHRMEHCGLITGEQIARAGKLNVAISFFIDHLRYYALTYKTDIFGDRVNRWTPLSLATKAGITWTIHQDHPAYPGDAFPFSNMKTAVTRCTRDDPTTPYGPEYRVSIHEALKAYTINAAWQLHREKDLGSITPGKKADLVVLSKNPYEVDPFDLESIEVVETYLEGRSNGFASINTIGNITTLAN